jgi:hypothetical protein
MSAEDINNLTNEIKRLKIVLEALEVSISSHNSNGSTPTSNITDTTTGQNNIRRANGFFSRNTVFNKGDRIVITNKVRSPDPNRPVNNGDRNGFVIGVAARRIDIETINGTQTWQAPHNLRLRLEHE